MFIVVEGIDGSGKTTLAKRLTEHYRALGKKVHMTREPGGTGIAEQLRYYLTTNDSNEVITPQAQIMLAFAARFQHNVLIEKLLRDGYIVICDRYYASTVAYNLTLNEADSQWYTLFKRLASECITPDFTFYLKVSPHTSNKRIAERNETISFHDALSMDKKQKLINGYNWFFTVMPDLTYVLDSENESLDVLFNKLLKLLPQ